MSLAISVARLSICYGQADPHLANGEVVRYLLITIYFQDRRKKNAKEFIELTVYIGEKKC